MKYSIVSKFIAILLAAITLVGAVVSAAGVALLGWLNLYSASSFAQWQEKEVQTRSEQLAQDMLLRWCIEEYSNLPEAVCYDAMYLYAQRDYEQWLGLVPDTYGYTIADGTGRQLLRYGEIKGQGYEYPLVARYPVEDPNASVAQAEENWYYEGAYHAVSYEESPEFTVTVYMSVQSLGDYDGIPVIYLDVLFMLRYWLIAALGCSMVIFAACVVYLCYVAGRSRHSDAVAPGALNKIPLDLYLAVAVVVCACLVALTVFILEEWVLNQSLNIGGLALVTMVLLVIATVIIGFFFAVAAQAKMGKTWWLRHTMIGALCILLFRAVRFVCRSIVALIHMLPVLWRWLLVATGMGLTLLMSILLAVNSGAGVLILLFVLTHCVGVVLYGAYAYGTLLTGAKRMAEGTLDSKIPTRFLMGSYKDCAQHLNALADVATVAARKQMQSERMKTELITNVSHDIKTPLTSIINYVDLLEKAESPEQSAQYLEVLGRQSQRLKKLIDDLMEMSKATTGNMAVDITTVDAAEAVNQALGEFADKLEKAQLKTVFTQPESSISMQADGRLIWRVLSNLLGNIVKYAQPGTRVYADVTSGDEHVCISLKNISREPLNISAEELTERFVRGDASRNTEGSGLGLNIAKSLMELQKGQLELLVDGDLFKVTLIFPSGR